MTLRNRLLLHKRHIVEMLQDKICTSKSELYLRFTQADVERLGTVCRCGLVHSSSSSHACIPATPQLSRRKWGQCMASVLDLENLPWMSLANTIAVLDSDGRVHYSSFLDR